MNLNLISALIIASYISMPSLARELSPREIDLVNKVSEINRANQEYIHQIKSRVNIKELPISKYLSFVILKNGCAPFMQTLEEIELQDDAFPDQSESLLKEFKLCEKSNIALKNFDPTDLEASSNSNRTVEE